MAHETGFSKHFSNKFEKSIYNSIQTWFPQSKVFHNCALPWTNGDITEVDLIVVSKVGLYVLECKNFSGMVSNEEGKWMHVIEHTDRPDFNKRFNDPFYQNNNHIRCLRKLLKLEDNIPVFSMVVFADKTDIDNVTYDFPLRTVVQGKKGVCTMIQRIEQKQKAIISRQQLESIAEQLDTYEPKSEEERLRNVRRIRAQKMRVL